MIKKLKDRRDHFIPQTYLEGFGSPLADTDKPLCVWHVMWQRWSTKGPGGIGWRRGFYDYVQEVESALGPDTADTAFVELENKFDGVRGKLIEANFQNWAAHLQFLIRFGQMLRCRSSMYIAQQTEQTEKDVVGTVAAVSQIERSVQLRPGKISASAARNIALARMQEEIEQGVTWMADYYWSIRVTDDISHPFIISDQPVVLMGDRPSFNEAFIDSQAWLLIPINWQACLYGRRAPIPSDERFVHATRHQMNEYRSLCMSNASEFVISPVKLI